MNPKLGEREERSLLSQTQGKGIRGMHLIRLSLEKTNPALSEQTKLGCFSFGTCQCHLNIHPKHIRMGNIVVVFGIPLSSFPPSSSIK